MTLCAAAVTAAVSAVRASAGPPRPSPRARSRRSRLIRIMDDLEYMPGLPPPLFLLRTKEALRMGAT